MKLTIKRLPFLKILNKVADGIPSKATDPVYTCFLLTLTNNVQSILASDGDIGICSSLQEEGEENPIVEFEPGTIEIPAKYLLDIVRQMEKETVTLTKVDQKLLNISDGKVNFNITCADGEQYPQLEFADETPTSFKVLGSNFNNLFDSTYFAVATKGPSIQYYGIKVSAEKEKSDCTFMASDTCRFAQRKVPAQVEEDFMKIIPVKALQLVAKYCEEKEVAVSRNENLARFVTNGLVITCRCIGGEEYRVTDRLIPSVTPYQLTVDSKLLQAALNRAIIVINADRTPVVLLSCVDGKVRLSAHCDNVGDSSEEIDPAIYEGENFQIKFNYNYVSDAIKALKSDKVTLAFSGENRGFLVKSEDPSIIQFITPIRSTSFN